MMNQKTVELKLQRIDICDLLIACTMLDNLTDEENTKWAKLHDKLEGILDSFDENNQ